MKRAATMIVLLPMLSSAVFAAPQGGSLADRYQRSLKELDTSRASEDQTRAERDAVAAQAKALQDQLVANAAKVQDIESALADTQAEIVTLDRALSVMESDFKRDRGRVAQLLAVLQRLDSDTPPALALRPEDSLSAARGAMQLGSVLPPVYAQTVSLSNRLKTMAETRNEKAGKAALAKTEAEALTLARADLDRLLQLRNQETATANMKLSELHGITEEIAKSANDLKGLIDRIANLRGKPGSERGMRLVTAARDSGDDLPKGSLRPPVIGKTQPGPPSGPAPRVRTTGVSGLWFESTPGASAIAPTDSEVVFAGPYQKFGQVLILEIMGGYHLTLAGLGRIDVRIGDQVLAGEPVGVLPQSLPARLYLELRRNGQTVDPAPWMSAELRKAKGT